MASPSLVLSCLTVLLSVSVQVKISDQAYSFGAFVGKDPTDVKEEKSTKIESQIEKVLGMEQIPTPMFFVSPNLFFKLLAEL